MKVIKSLFVTVIAISMAAAQSAPPSASTAAKPQAAKGASATPAAAVSVQKPAISPTKNAAAKPATAAAKPATAATAPTAKPAVAATGTPKAKKPALAKGAADTDKDKSATAMRDKRDPFVSVIQKRSSLSPTCPAGKKCLIVDQLVLKGVVKSHAGMLAVVENSQRKAYFLRENDPVFNGQVYKITGDSIIFKEKVLDRLGKESVREVVKRVTKPA